MIQRGFFCAGLPTQFGRAADSNQTPTHQTLQWGVGPLRRGASNDGAGMTANTFRQRRRHAIALADARVVAKERNLEIAEAIKAEAGVRLHSVCDALSGCCWPGRRMIAAPEGRTRRQLYVLARECARVALHREGRDIGIADDILDLKVAQWAQEALSRHGC